MNILRFQLGQMQANCYLLIKDKDCLIIDPGDSADFILEQVSIKNLKVLALFATHGHFDHVMAAGEIQAALDIPFYISDKDMFLLKRASETARYFLGHAPETLPVKEIKDLKSGNFRISKFEFRVLSTPGHTPGSVCLYFPSKRVIFTGDTLFKNGIGRHDFSYSNKKQLITSVNYLTEVLPKETIVYSGHGEETTIGEEINLISTL